MNRYFFLALIAGVTVGAAQTQAMPVSPIAVSSVIIPVASGCGLGVHRGPVDGCETIFDGNFAGAGRNPYNQYVGFARNRICGGRGAHLACNGSGLCRVVCN
jgi:hypothetical protein